MKNVFFCHGMPGSQKDADLLAAANPDAHIVAIDLLSAPAGGVGDVFLSALDGHDKADVTVVGFSIGAMAAIQIAALHPNIVSKLILVSPAAPLSLGDFLPKMAGKPVFELAIKRPMVLRALTKAQGVIARLSPNTMINMLFGKCGPAEKALLLDPMFRPIITQGLRASFLHQQSNYLSYVTAYVEDWSGALDMVQCPVDLWHGSKDTWSPSEMSDALKDRLGDKATLNMVQDAEHYSTLTKAIL